MGVVGLSNKEKNHLKQLLDKGIIIPLAVIYSTVEDLKDIISRNPLQQKIGAELVWFSDSPLSLHATEDNCIRLYIVSSSSSSSSRSSSS